MLRTKSAVLMEVNFVLRLTSGKSFQPLFIIAMLCLSWLMGFFKYMIQYVIIISLVNYFF